MGEWVFSSSCLCIGRWEMLIMIKWTVRNVEADAVEAIRRLRDEFGETFGAVLTVCIRCGIDDARLELQRQVEQESDMREALAEEVAAMQVQLLELANAVGALARARAE
jgi:hypothetical protein